MEITAPTGLSYWRLVENADPVVQAVMLGLAVASVLCWTICFEKLLRYSVFSRQVRETERFADSSITVTGGWLSKRFQLLAKQEVREPGEHRSGFQERIERILSLEITAQLRRLQAGLSILATVGSTAPFVGLFGTVWGIMNSFSSIAAAKDTSLAVVAPGIAEALLATAIGLAAAIPAVIFYNLANVFLSTCFERLTVVASCYAKSVAYGIRQQISAGSSGDAIYDREMQGVIDGGAGDR
jgi:biopolymer transport protein ExbB/TolQ